MNLLFKFLKMIEKFVLKIQILRNPICQLLEISHMTAYFLQTANNNQFLKIQHYQLLSQFLRDTMAQFSLMVKQVQEKRIQCKVGKANYKVSFQEQSDTYFKQLKEQHIQRNILFVQHFYSFTMRS